MAKIDLLQGTFKILILRVLNRGLMRALRINSVAFINVRTPSRNSTQSTGK